MYAPEQSDRLVVPKKRSNKGTAARCDVGPAETVEERSLPEGNS